MPQRTRVVITGMGVVTPIGNSLAEFWDSIVAGKSGGGPITRFDASNFDTHFACEVKNFIFCSLISTAKKSSAWICLRSLRLRRRCRRLMTRACNSNRSIVTCIGVIFGSGIGGMWTYHNQQQLLYDRAGKPDRISPFFIPMLIADIAAGYISIRWQLHQPIMPRRPHVQLPHMRLRTP